MPRVRVGDNDHRAGWRSGDEHTSWVPLSCLTSGGCHANLAQRQPSVGLCSCRKVDYSGASPAQFRPQYNYLIAIPGAMANMNFEKVKSQMHSLAFGEAMGAAAEDYKKASLAYLIIVRNMWKSDGACARGCTPLLGLPDHIPLNHGPAGTDRGGTGGGSGPLPPANRRGRLAGRPRA